MLLARRNILTDAADLPISQVDRAYHIRIARDAWELRGYAELRRRTFCVEQGLFDVTDRDEHDARSTPIIAVSTASVCDDEIVGCVRIFPTDRPGEWYGSRLGVAPDWRGCAPLAAGLIRKAVCTAHARGCTRFLATVQRQNVPLFRRLHWTTIEPLDVRGRPHHLMQADLTFYPPLDVAIEWSSLRAAS